MENRVKQHYACPELALAIRAGLEKMGKDTDRLTTRDLGSVDQLHTGGGPATMAIGKDAGLAEGSLVLDAGCGIGGSSRVLAEKFKLQVVGIDLAPDFIDTARILTQWCGLDTPGTIRFQQGSVLDLPFDPRHFDAVLCQHILVNIEDKARALAEFNRVLKPGGKLILHEITSGPGPAPLLPGPWAADASISFPSSWEALKGILEQTGFKEDYFSDETENAAAGWKTINAIREKKGVHPLNPSLIFGNKAASFGPNLEKNFTQKSIGCIKAFFTKSG